MKKHITWPQHLEHWTSSGLTKMAYCDKYNLNDQMFFHHQKKSEVKTPDIFQEVEAIIPEYTTKLSITFRMVAFLF
jgi:hypothetical protein